MPTLKTTTRSRSSTDTVGAAAASADEPCSVPLVPNMLPCPTSTATPNIMLSRPQLQWPFSVGAFHAKMGMATADSVNLAAATQPTMNNSTGPTAAKEEAKSHAIGLNVGVKQPTNRDVMCGRGGATNNHLGNVYWRKLCTMSKPTYLRVPKRLKMEVSKSIVAAVRAQDPPGRFLQKNEKDGLWYDIGDQKAQDKTSQALREGAPEMRKQLIKEAKIRHDSIARDPNKKAPTSMKASKMKPETQEYLKRTCAGVTKPGPSPAALSVPLGTPSPHNAFLGGSMGMGGAMGVGMGAPTAPYLPCQMPMMSNPMMFQQAMAWAMR